MNILSDVITYVRRIIKSPSNAEITDSLIIDYINRFWLMDVDARIQLFDLKTKYSFMTVPGQDKYNMPLYDLQIESPDQDPQSINYYPVYQGFVGPAYVRGVPVSFQTQKSLFYGFYPNVIQSPMIIGTGNGTAGPYNLQIPIIGQQVPQNPPFNCILRGHVDITGVIRTGQNEDPPLVTNLELINPVQTFIQDIPVTSVDSAVYITSIDTTGANVEIRDSGQFIESDVNLGLLMTPGKAPNGNLPLQGGYYQTFVITGATQATQAVITTPANFSAGLIVTVNNVVGMTELNGNSYTVVSSTPTTVTLNVDSTGFTPYISGGDISSTQNVINYFNGQITNVFFPKALPQGANIYATCYFFQSGLPRAILYYNNTLTLRSPPALQYLVELDAYLSPAAYLNSSDAIQFAYMSEYIARGAARKILSDTGDVEQFNFYEPFFIEQELLVWKRSQRQWTATRTETLYSQGNPIGRTGFGYFGGIGTGI